jgi:predicted TIM-barrel fold metal-dependent hydrolase
VVHIEAGWTGNPVDETAWLQSVADGEIMFLLISRYLADKDGIPHGIIGFCDFRKETNAVESCLAGHLNFENFRGIRQIISHSDEIMSFAHENLLENSKWRENFALLGKYNLSFEAWMYHHQLHDFADFACQFPNTSIILDHYASPLGTDSKTFELWKLSLEKIAKCSNVFVKLSGFGMPCTKFFGYCNKLSR